MRQRSGTGAPRRRRFGLRGAALAILLAGLATEAIAAPPRHPIVVRGDRGGEINARLKEIRELRRTNAPIEIRGRICMSSCTMYLGLEKVCIHPTTRFGFHGPSFRGRSMYPPEFDRWSKIMAGHYREPLRGWFMKTGRHRVRGYFDMTGATLIRMGYTPCTAAGEATRVEASPNKHRSP